MSTVEVNGQSIAYHCVGSGDPLVVINGLAATKDDWDPTFLAALTRHHRLVLVDNRGLGGSTGPTSEFTAADLAGDVAAVIDALELQRPNVLGWSMGGFAALTLTQLHPDNVGKLILLGTTAGGKDLTASSKEVHDKLRDLSGSPREQASRLISLLFTPQRAGVIDQEFGQIVADARAALDDDVVANQIRLLDSWERNGFSGDLTAIATPTLVACGCQDAVFPAENSVQLAAQIPGAWLAQFPDAAHALMADHPNSLAELITTFVTAG